ncbi:MAG: carbonic anhydrase [Minisyncoccia bacterium]
MRQEKNNEKKHSCSAVLFTCLDWRLHPQIENYFKQKYRTFDLCVVAGSLKGLLDKTTQDYFLKQIEISQKLHNSKTIILTMHKDCGAYGGSLNFKDPKEEFSHHKNILAKTEKIVFQKFPKTKVLKYFINLEFKKDKWVSHYRIVR